MWPSDGMNPMAPYFQAAKAMAANVPQPGERGNYTVETFLQAFPQFRKAGELEEGETAESLVPAAMLENFVEQANDSVLPSRWGSMHGYAAGLYVAHFSALYLKTYAEGSANGSAAAAGAVPAGAVKTAAMGDTTISYDNSAITAGTEKWGAWNATQYGQQLVALARMVGMGGMYVI